FRDLIAVFVGPVGRAPGGTVAVGIDNELAVVQTDGNHEQSRVEGVADAADFSWPVDPVTTRQTGAVTGVAAEFNDVLETAIGSNDARRAGPVIVDERIAGKCDPELRVGIGCRRTGRGDPS